MDYIDQVLAKEERLRANFEAKKKVIKINMEKFLRAGLPAIAIFAFLIGAIALKGLYSILALICM